MKKLYYWLIVIMLGLTVFATAQLVIDEYNMNEICPKVGGIPACYIVLSLFALALVVHLIGQEQRLYIISIVILFLMATFGSIGELSGSLSCPRTSGGTPMCYISFVICTILLALKYRMTRTK